MQKNNLCIVRNKAVELLRLTGAVCGRAA